MSATPRVPRETAAPETAKKLDYGEQIGQWFTSGVGRIAEVQKKSIEVAAQQSAEAIALWKKTVEKTPGAPGVFMLDLMASGFERLAETQKGAIDLMVEQSKAAAEVVKERAATAAKTGESAVHFAQETVDRAAATHRKALDHAAAQTKAIFDTAKQQFSGGPVEAAADSIQRGVNAIVDAQKELLEMATTR